ncbi:MAG: hypothetical protein ACREXP_24375 [Steroidobacteraceae bacterium]
MKRVAATALLAIGLLHGAAAVSQDGPGKSDQRADSSAAARAAAEQARAEAARQLKAPLSEFTVVTIEPTQWSDSSLGCGKANSMYTEVVSSGYIVVLEREGERHQVNVAGSRAVMCAPNMRLSGTVRQPMSARGLDRVTNLARQDLANRLHLDVQHVRVANVEPRRWTDDDMNCTSDGGTPAVEAPAAAAGSASAVGYRLALSASGRTYFYHTDLRSVRACPPI